MQDPYERARGLFEWKVPDRFQIGVDICDAWALRDPDRTAIIELAGDRLEKTSYGVLRRRSNQLANFLTAAGVRREDRVAILISQRVETVIAHIATYKTGAIAVPLSSLFGPDALLHRMNDSGCRIVLTDHQGQARLEGIRSQLPRLEGVFSFDEGAAQSLNGLIKDLDATYEPVETRADDPALIIYTSGTTGASKGALHAHRVLLGHLPGVEMSHSGFPREHDCIWTPADWSWIGGLLDVVFPALHHGVPVVAHRFGKFDAASAFDLMERCGVRNTFLPPTALKMLRNEERPKERWKLSLRSIASGGESLGAELLAWGREQLGVEINEFYGQTECNMVLSSSAAWFAAKPGAIGKAAPGHDVRIVDDGGQVLPPHTEGDIAIRSPDPVMFLGYWNNAGATAEKFRGEWLITGDRGTMDEEGYFHFLGRLDDVITSAGYRIGPGEIEDCLLRHPAVASAGVVGAPDPLRTETVTAFVVPRAGFEAGSGLVRELQDHVRERLGAYQYPRRVIFLNQLPMTVTGKILRRELRALATTDGI